MALNENQIAWREQGRVTLRPDGVRARWELRNLSTSDSHSVNANFSCIVRAVDASADIQMLVETFLSNKPYATAADVAEQFRPALHAAAERQASAQSASQILDPANKPDWIGILTKAAASVAFISGVEILPPYQLDFDSPSLRRQQADELQRQANERRAAEQINSLQRSSALFRQFQEMRQTAPELSAGQILQRISPADQGELLRAMLEGAGRTAEASPLWTVSGSTLVKIDPRGSMPKSEKFELAETLGPLRSVDSANIDGRRMLVIGAQTGVMIVDPVKPGDVRIYRDRSITSPLGFNRVVVRRDEIWATHSEAGLVGWSLNDPEKPIAKLKPPATTPVVAGGTEVARGPRNLFVVDDHRLLFSSGPRLMLATGDQLSTLLGDENNLGSIVAILAENARITVVFDSGRVCRLDPETLSIITDDRPAGRVCAAGLLPWFGSSRLLLTTEEGMVHCVGSDDPLITQYQSNHRGLRMVAAASDVVAAVSADRQRIVLWTSWEGRKPAAELNVYGLTRHRIADIELV